MFQTAEDTDKSLFDQECYLLQNFQFRDLSSKYRCKPKFYEYQSTRGATLKIDVEACFVLVPLSWTSLNILDFAVKLGKNLMKSHSKEDYELYYPSAFIFVRLVLILQRLVNTGKQLKPSFKREI